jgi:hypothetical protein
MTSCTFHRDVLRRSSGLPPGSIASATSTILGRTFHRPPNEPMLRIMRAIGMTVMSAVCVRSLPTARRSTPCSLRCSHACVGRAHSSLKVSMPSDRPTSAALIGDVVTGSGTGKSFAPPTSTPNEIQGADRCRRPVTVTHPERRGVLAATTSRS